MPYRSDGWRRKVVDNPNINADPRNQGLAAGCDGIPFFKDKNSRNGWPFVVTDENLPTGAYRKNQHQHMFALVPSEEMRYDVHGTAYTHKKDPESIQPVLLVFADELLHGQDTGFPIRDFSVHEEDPEHFFFLKVILLFFMGDYPGQGKVANMIHAGQQACHWCYHKFQYHSSGHNVALGTRQHLPTDSTLRDCPTFSAPEHRPPPHHRDNDNMCATGQELDAMERGPELHRRQKECGVYGSCILCSLDLFDMVWDITGDMMHLLKQMWKHRLMPMLKAEFKQAPPKEPATTYANGAKPSVQVPYSRVDRLARKKKFEAQKREWAKSQAVSIPLNAGASVFLYLLLHTRTLCIHASSCDTMYTCVSCWLRGKWTNKL